MSPDPYLQAEREAIEAAIVSLRGRGLLGSDALAEALRSTPRSVFASSDTPLEQLYGLDGGVVLETAADGLPVSSLTCLSYVASILETAQIGPSQHVLEIGTASGFSAALLGHLVGRGGEVVTVEIEAKLAAWARRLLRGQATVVQADGFADLGEHGIFDRILVNVAAPSVPAMWLDHLRVGGCLVAVIQGPGACFLLRGWKDATGGLAVDRFVHFGGWNRMVVTGLEAQPWFRNDNERCPTVPDDTPEAMGRWFRGARPDPSSASPACLLELPEPLPEACYRSDLAVDPQCHLLWVLSRLAGMAWRLGFVCIRSDEPSGRGMRHLRWIQCRGATAELVFGSGRWLRDIDRGDAVSAELAQAMRIWQRCAGDADAALVGRVERPGVCDTRGQAEWRWTGATTSLCLSVGRATGECWAGNAAQ